MPSDLTPASPLPPEADHVLVAVNPQAGRGSAARRVERLAELLGPRGFPVEIFTDLGEVTARANRLHARGRLRALVGVGGDGTAAEMANRTHEGVPITLLAAGTSNLLARQLGLSAEPHRLCRTIVEGNLLRLDAGRAGGRVFLVMMSCGFDADVVQRVHDHRNRSRRGGHISYWSYAKPILASIRSYGYPEIRVYCGGSGDGPAEDRLPPLVVRWAFAFNLPCYGWGLPLAPEAVATDGLLDLCAFRRGSLLDGLRYLVAAQFGGWHGRLSDCEMRRGRWFRIVSDEPVAYQLDGDPGGVLPVDVEVVPNRLTLVAPLSDQEKKEDA